MKNLIITLALLAICIAFTSSDQINLSQKNFYLHSYISSEEAIEMDTLTLQTNSIDSDSLLSPSIWFWHNGKFEATFGLKVDTTGKTLLHAVYTSDQIKGKWTQSNDSLFITNIIDNFDTSKQIIPLTYKIILKEDKLILVKVKK